MRDMYEMFGNGSPDILTTEEVAKLLRVCTRTVYRLVRQNRIPHIKVFDKFRFERTAVMEWLRSQHTTDTPPAKLGKKRKSL
jgi:excisionase family DNA binding protein